MRLTYTVLMQLLGFVLWPYIWLKGQRDAAYQGRVGERFGFIPTAPQGVAVWVHAVSVGEVMAAAPLIRALIARHGEGRIAVTATTATGSAQVQALFGARVRHSYAPYDIYSVVARTLSRLKPERVVVMETELWPILFRTLRQRGVPITIANARLSPRSMKGYGRVAGFARSVLGDVTLVAAQSAADAERYRALGAARVVDLGNLKFDIQPDPQLIDQGARLRAVWGTRPVWVAASTHEGEDEAALAAHQRLLQRWPDAVLILVPRHPRRFERVGKRIAETGLNWVARSAQGMPDIPPQVLLGDSMGEMWWYLALADAAFVGGSLVPVGGHNVLEPAALALPVVFGPHMHNFAVARDLLLHAGGAVQIADAAALGDTLADWFADADQRHRIGTQAQTSLTPHRGALQRLLDALEGPQA